MIRLAWLALLAIAAFASSNAHAASDREIFAFHAEWMQSGRPSLHAHADQIDVLMPDWLRLNETDGGLVEFAVVEADATMDLLDDLPKSPRIAPSSATSSTVACCPAWWTAPSVHGLHGSG